MIASKGKRVYVERETIYKYMDAFYICPMSFGHKTCI